MRQSWKHESRRGPDDARRLADFGASSELRERARRHGWLLSWQQRLRLRQCDQLHQWLLHPGRGLHWTDDAAHIPQVPRLGADRYAQPSLRGRPVRQRARLHGRLSQSLHEDRDQLFHRQPGGGRSARSADLLAAIGSLGRHADLVPRPEALQGCTLPSGECLREIYRGIRCSVLSRLALNRS